MNRFTIFYQSLVLFALYRFGLCQILQYELPLESAHTSTHIDGSERCWGTGFISKYRFSDRFIFSPDELNELCGGVFSAQNVEILELFDQEMSFAIVRPENDSLVYIKVVFEFPKDIQTFFRDVRAAKRHLYRGEIKVNRIFQYPKENLRDNVPTALTPFSQGNSFYVKKIVLPAEMFDKSKSFNFLRIKSARSEAADLILRSRTFNISSRLGGNTYVLCSDNVENFIYLILFPDESSANAFEASVKSHVNHGIACNNYWLTPHHLQQIDEPKMYGLRQLYFSRRCT